MSIGYACKLVGVKNTDTKTCVLKNATSEKIIELSKHNLYSLNNIIDYNISNNIKLFRISSDIIPFGSSEINKTRWWEIFSDELTLLGNKIKSSNMRVSMHPGQYTVLNSNNDDVVKRAVEDLVYHARVLDGMQLDSRHKIVLHIGGAYDNKTLATQRFIENYKELDEKIKNRLVIENDDKIYTAEEVLEIGNKLSIPVIFDNLHNLLNPSSQNLSEKYWIEQCKHTWKKKDGNQKIHYSQQAENKIKGTHSDFITVKGFKSFYDMIPRPDLDIMLEVKDKNLSCIKCINSTNSNISINELEKEWSKYKYTVMERSQKNYLSIKELLKYKQNYSAVSFYTLIEDSLKSYGSTESYSNSALHVWGYFKTKATDKEKDNFFKILESYKTSQTSITSVKNNLNKLSEKYKEDYLLNSYYFAL